MCTSHHLWEKHLKQKWGKVLVEYAYQQWQSKLTFYLVLNNYGRNDLLCSHAKVKYDYRTNTFVTRYPSEDRERTEVNIEWHKHRRPQLGTLPYMLHVSDCLNELKPGDHIEIKRRRSNELPYGWRYAVIGHLEYCDGSENHCSCQHSGGYCLNSTTNVSASKDLVVVR
ncbi:F-box protein At2g41170 [Morus notabilis]|uniref:F-box protein At2g41170 n=1 Tax=Morus notabilis TaxID=981085 RepID=UPI000CED4C00|nr:F-box protein At2g41170 [Morus notabilis]